MRSDLGPYTISLMLIKCRSTSYFPYGKRKLDVK